MDRRDGQWVIRCPYGLPTLLSFAMRSWPSSLVWRALDALRGGFRRGRSVGRHKAGAHTGNTETVTDDRGDGI